MSDKQIGKHVFVFNPKDNSGESLTLTTNLYQDIDVVYTDQTLTLGSYCNSVQFNLSGAQLTPENLRQLANELESVLTKAKAGIE